MSFFSTVITDATKGVQWLLNAITNVNKYAAIFQKLSPTMLTAIMAVFYDAMKTVSSAEAVVAAGASGNVQGAITLSATTAALLEKLAADFHAGEQSVVDGFKALNLPTPPAPPVAAS